MLIPLDREPLPEEPGLVRCQCCHTLGRVEDVPEIGNAFGFTVDSGATITSPPSPPTEAEEAALEAVAAMDDAEESDLIVDFLPEPAHGN